MDRRPAFYIIHFKDINLPLKIDPVKILRAIATSPVWEGVEGRIILVYRPLPVPLFAILGYLDEHTAYHVQNLGRHLKSILGSIRYIDYKEAEAECEKLALKLKERFGHDELRGFHYIPIPRGGLIVLGMLSYVLDLRKEQLQPPASEDVPVVVVDDCVFSGYRFGRFIRNIRNSRIVFAHLFSHPELRTAIEAEEPEVIACISASDLKDYGHERFGQSYHELRQEWKAQLPGPRYWIGSTEHIVFAWSEPGLAVRNPFTKGFETLWNIMPAELCLKTRHNRTGKIVEVQQQPQGRGPLRPSEHVVFGDFGDCIVVGNIKSKKSFLLKGVSGDIWRCIVRYGNIRAVVEDLLQSYDIDREGLRREVEDFIHRLIKEKLIVRDSNAPEKKTMTIYKDIHSYRKS